jgi:hypothetical protein
MFRQIFIVTLATALTLPSMAFAAPDTAVTLSPADVQIDHDLESLLTTQNEILGHLQEENLSLLDASLKYNRNEAWITILASFGISYFLLREPAKMITMYATNFRLIIESLRAGKKLKDITLFEDGTKIILGAVAINASISIAYMATNLYSKGICFFNCLDDFAKRISDQQEQEFLASPTFKNIEKEIGPVKAMRFYAMIKTIRSESYGNLDSLKIMKHFIEADVNMQKFDSMDDLKLPNAPTFKRVVEVINQVHDLTAIVGDYIRKTEKVI